MEWAMERAMERAAERARAATRTGVRTRHAGRLADMPPFTAALMSSPNPPSASIQVVFEQGRTWTLAELPPCSIALDGAVRGAAFDNDARRYSFDHHDGVLRHIALATCEQVRDALLVGLDPTGFTVFVNDVDGDTIVAVWLLLHPARLRGPEGARVRALVDAVGRVDALGPAVGPALPLHRALGVPAGTAQSVAVLHERLAVLDAWWGSGAAHDAVVEATAPPRADADAVWLDASGDVVRGRVAGMAGLYAVADVGVLGEPAADGTTAYTIGKRSEFVAYDVGAFLARMNAREPGWGGGSTVGGAPRLPGGQRSRLSFDDVAVALAAGAPATTRGSGAR